MYRLKRGVAERITASKEEDHLHTKYELIEINLQHLR